MIHSFQLEKLNKNNKQNITLVQFTRQHFMAATITTVSYNLSFFTLFSLAYLKTTMIVTTLVGYIIFEKV